MLERSFQLRSVTFVSRNLDQINNARARQEQALFALLMFAFLHRTRRCLGPVLFLLGGADLIFDRLALPSPRHTAAPIYFNRAPFGASSVNVAITGLPSSPTD